MKTAFIFPGQGAQFVGMGKEFYDKYQEAREVFEAANRVSGLNLEQICFEENDEINQTEYTQIAMLTVEIAMLKAVLKEGIKPDICAGLSLGEYGALAACEAMEVDELLGLVRNRGIYMQNAYPTGGAMTAVLGMEGSEVQRICNETPGEVYVANYNCPGQIVISGKDDAVAKAAEELSKNGAKRCIPLKVSGPFHSPLLNEASEKLAKDLSQVTIKKPQIPYYTNVGARLIDSNEEIADLLAKQVVSSVMWQQSVEAMVAQGVDTFVEIGPGKTLQGFIKKIAPEAKVFTIGKPEDIDALKA